MPELTLYVDGFFISPYAFSAFVTLREKGLSFDVKTVALQSREQHRPEYQSGSITGRVPSLRHGDFWLAESSAIVEYLDDAFPETVRALPSSLHERARARQVMAWLRSDLLALREDRPTTSIFYEAVRKPLSPNGAAAAAKLVAVADRLLPNDRPSLLANWCAADADLALMLQRLRSSDHPLPPKIDRFVAAQWARPSVRAWVERERPPYVAY